MQINGSGGSFEQRVYEEVDAEVAWKIGLLIATEMGVKDLKRDDTAQLLNGTLETQEKTLFLSAPITKLFTFAVKPLSEGCQVILDIRKEKLEVYNFKPQNKETKQFFLLFDDKLAAFAAAIVCPGCGKRIGKDVKFCPYCGFKVGK